MNFAVKMDVSLQAQSKPLSTLSAFSYIPPRRGEPEDMSYFHQESKVPEVSMYDRVYHQAEGYDMKLHRDDRKHSKGRGLDINKEERSRAVPVLSSSVYGHRPVPALDVTGRQYAHVACVRTEFFMKNGIIWNVAEGYGSVAPL
ncbi:cilia- and flagella-associated protein 90 [Platichthys flesus]|uniref:cilia- and flagella-associated protein 90 n=1 Tax=Platichthys flesus TaxID=8260 RepID=UPI002DB6A0E1|nr:cilia- and flagella-associated protein 90 [Platichthys flesus]